MRRDFYSPFPGVTREEGGWSEQTSHCASVSAAVVSMGQASDCGLCRFPSPSPLPPPAQTRFGLWPFPGAADEHGTITWDPSCSAAGSSHSPPHCLLSSALRLRHREPAISWAPHPACRAGSPLAGSSLRWESFPWHLESYGPNLQILS